MLGEEAKESCCELLIVNLLLLNVVEQVREVAMIFVGRLTEDALQKRGTKIVEGDYSHEVVFIGFHLDHFTTLDASLEEVDGIRGTFLAFEEY